MGSVLYVNNKKREQLMSVYRRAMGIILPIFMLSFLFSGLICFAANDMYAFSKNEKEVMLYINTPCSLNEISILLKDNGVINDSTFFMLYVKSKGKADVIENFCGKITLNASMSYREILNSFS